MDEEDERDPLEPFTQDQIDVALAALEVHQDLKAAAHFSNVPAGLLRRWKKRADERPERIWTPGERPMPSDEILEDDELLFLFDPAPEVDRWLRQTFLDRASPVYNPEHIHLVDARLGILWTNCPMNKGGKFVAGQAERPGGGSGGKWAKARAELQQWEWFGGSVDFIITLYAPYCAEASDASFMALVEHEMYHCAQKRDRFGDLAFNDDGFPVFTQRGHDAEEFVGIVRRYGVGAAAAGVKELVAAAGRPPSVAPASIASVCGTCMR